MFKDVSIRLRLTGWYLLNVTLIFAIMGVVSWWAMRASLYAAIDDALDRRIVNVYNDCVLHPHFTLPELRKELEDTAKVTWGGGLYQMFTEDGALVFQSDGLARHGVTTQAPLIQPGKASHRDIETPDWPVRLGARLVSFGGKDWIIEQGEPLGLAEDSLRSFAHLLLFAVPLLIGIGTAVSYGISSRALAPVDWIIRDARSINSGNLSDRLSVPKAHDELRRLSETLNSMLDRIESSMRHIQQFTADASHELRSPITLIRTAAEYSLRRERSREELLEAMVRIARESEHTTQLISDLLLLTRADAQVDLCAKSFVDFSIAARDVLERIAPLAQNKNVKIVSEIPATPILVEGGQDLVERLVFILVDNALKFTLHGGKVTLTLSETGGSAVLEVFDTGIGIAAEDLAHVFDRFWRVDKVRSRQEGGSGLGLSIAQKIVEQCGGTIRAESEIDRGSHFTVSMPLAYEDRTNAEERLPRLHSQK
jgi:signal transduction histidine kinase